MVFSRPIAVERLGHKQSLTDRRLTSQVTELALDGAPTCIDSLWIDLEPVDIRACTASARARIVAVFSHAYLFANRRANRVKVLVRWKLLPCACYGQG